MSRFHTFRFSACHFATCLICGLFLITACDKTNPATTSTAVCEDSRTGNAMSANIAGDVLCTDLGSALVFDFGTPTLTVVGFFGDSDPGGSITLNIEDPAKGEFTLSDGQYSSEDESVYYIVTESEGNGMVELTDYTADHVAGTFEFNAVEIDASTAEATGRTITVSDGAFDFALLSE
jgi:hypothetical protein